jgi:hypothetical protein
MTIEVKITGGNGITAGGQFEADVHTFRSSDSLHSGLVTLARPFSQFLPSVEPLLNDTYGTQMNQNVVFSGTPELIEDGAAGG